MMLLEGLRESICLAGAEYRHPTTRHQKAVIRAQRIVTGLYLSLNNRSSLPLVKQLAGVLRYVLHQLNRISSKNRHQISQEILEIITPISLAIGAYKELPQFAISTSSRQYA